VTLPATGVSQKEVRARAAAIVLERDGLQAAGWRLLLQNLRDEWGQRADLTPANILAWMDGYQFSIEDHLKAAQP
jgi:hypothetical protein